MNPLPLLLGLLALGGEADAPRPLAVVETGDRVVRETIFSPDSRRFAVTAAVNNLPFYKFRVYACEVATGEILAEVAADERSADCWARFSPDGRYWLVRERTPFDGDRCVRVWDLAESPPREMWNLPGGGESLFLADGKTLLVARGNICLFDLTGARKEPLVVEREGESYSQVEVSPDGRYFATTIYDRSALVAADMNGIFGRPPSPGREPFKPGAVRVWESATGKEVASMTVDPSGILGCYFSPRANTLNFRTKAVGKEPEYFRQCRWSLPFAPAGVPTKLEDREIFWLESIKQFSDRPNGARVEGSRNDRGELGAYETTNGIKRIGSFPGAPPGEHHLSPDGKTAAVIAPRKKGEPGRVTLWKFVPEK